MTIDAVRCAVSACPWGPPEGFGLLRGRGYVVSVRPFGEGLRQDVVRGKATPQLVQAIYRLNVLHLVPPDTGRCVVSWQDRASCRGAVQDIWFPERGESDTEAKAVCAGCPVREECLEFALTEGIIHGVWGGLSGRQRRRLVRVTIARAARRNVAACGTESGAQAHKRRGEPNCQACRLAVNKASRERKAKQKRGEAA